MKKIQQFYILKFTSGRIRNAKYNINITLEEARKNGEVVSVAENQVIDSLLKMQGRTFEPDEIKKIPSLLVFVRDQLDVGDVMLPLCKLLRLENILSFLSDRDATVFVPDVDEGDGFTGFVLFEFD